MRTSDGGHAGLVQTLSATEPVMLAPAEFASGVPTVRFPDACPGGAHDWKLSGAPWLRLVDLHRLNAGTSGRKVGVAPLGRTKPRLLGGRGPGTWWNVTLSR